MSGAGETMLLMYHAIAVGPAPLCTDPEIFSDQLQALAEAGMRGVALRDYLEARAGGKPLAPGSVVLTFDDGYEDFFTTARPCLAERGWWATVFLPCIRIGADRASGAALERHLDWSEVRALADEGFELGAHGISHEDLRRLAPERAEEEIRRSGEMILERTGRPVLSFAAPYGASSPALRKQIARWYRGAVGTRFDLASPEAPLFDLPRIEMWYFRHPGRWRRFLEGRRGYFRLRRFLRRLGSLRPVSPPRGEM